MTRQPLSTIGKIIYGSGDWGKSSFNTLRQIFYAIFLTDVVGLDPRLASIAALIGIVWDAINDPVIGAFSDSVRTRWGRRRPFLILFCVPFALAFLLLWWAPPWRSQLMLVIHITLAYMLSDTIQTFITVPYLALTPEIAPGYDERTSLTTFRMFFNLIASLATAVAAPMIIDACIENGLSLQQGYLIIGALFGGLAIIPFVLIFSTIREKAISEEARVVKPSIRSIFYTLWQNRPFRIAAGIYALNWISFDLMGLMLPYFILYWVSQGDLLAKTSLFGINLAVESVVFGILIITAMITLPFWNWFSRKYSKSRAYIIGMSFWIIVQLLILTILPGQMGFIMALAFLTGLSVSNAHIIPDAIFPDVIDWDELRTHQRKEGMYYGAINLVRKLSSALATFLALQVLGWFGYQSPPQDVIVFNQGPTTILAIRILTGPVVAIFLLTAIFLAWKYPLNRERQEMIRRSLTRRNRG
jgi:glycoside/pentoside/hexuronide:cation symporter, GPH family